MSNSTELECCFQTLGECLRGKLGGVVLIQQIQVPESGLASDPCSAGNKCADLAAAWNTSICHFAFFVGDFRSSKSFPIYVATSSCDLNTSMHGCFAQ